MVNQKTVRKLTARFRVTGPSVGDVTIQEFTDFHHITMLDGRVEIAQGIKSYNISPSEPVNRDDAGFSLARTGERLVVL